MASVVLMAVLLKGFWARIAILLGLIFGYLVSWLFDAIFGQINSCGGAGGTPAPHDRISWASVKAADWIGLPDATKIVGGKEVPGFHGPTFPLTFSVFVLPGLTALSAENTGHVRAVAEMTGDDRDPYLGRALIGDGVGT